MKNLWKVTVNNWGWRYPRTFYAESREGAEAIASKFPASNSVEYAGRFSDEKASNLTRPEAYIERR